MSKREIACRRSNYLRRLRYLQKDLGYPDDHLMVSWNLRQLRILDAMEVFKNYTFMSGDYIS